MSDLRSEAGYVEAELVDDETQHEETQQAEPTEDTQAIDVVEIVESEPGSLVLEEHVAEQEWTREFAIEDDAPAGEGGAVADLSAPDQERVEPAAEAQDEQAEAAEVAGPRIQSMPMV